MKSLSLFLIALSSGIYPVVSCAASVSSDEEIRDIVKPCVDKIVSTVEGSGDGFSDDDLIKCASDITRKNDKIRISKAIAIVGFYAGEAYKPANDLSHDSNPQNSNSQSTAQRNSVQDTAPVKTAGALTPASDMTDKTVESKSEPSDRKSQDITLAGTSSSSSDKVKASVDPVPDPEKTTASDPDTAITACNDPSLMKEKDDSKRAVVGSSPDTAEESESRAVVVSATRIITDYELNEEKADDVYKDRRLCIKGKISKISVLGDDPFVEMSADSYGLRNVKFTLDRKRIDVVDSLQVGDIKVIEGTVVGYYLFKVSVTDPVLY